VPGAAARHDVAVSDEFDEPVPTEEAPGPDGSAPDDTPTHPTEQT
jgi:hypothetical protein